MFFVRERWQHGEDDSFLEAPADVLVNVVISTLLITIFMKRRRTVIARRMKNKKIIFQAKKTKSQNEIGNRGDGVAHQNVIFELRLSRM